MPVREPIAAGSFYPAAPQDLQKEVLSWLSLGAQSGASMCCGHKAAQSPGDTATLAGFMLPHAGHVYCGRVIGATLASPWNSATAGAFLPQRVIFLCPNHTGQGHPLGVWPEGAWRTPLGDVPVDAEIAAALCDSKSDGFREHDSDGFSPDMASHLGEHSIEVLLPFLQCLPAPEGGKEAQRSIIPVCVGTRQPHVLREAGLALARIIRRYADRGEQVGVIVSSDMNHFENQEATMHKDANALAQALACDPDGLLGVVTREHITMCGASPMTLALFAAHALGDPWAELCLYDTSATASGDASRVVGYAGLRFGLA